MRSPFFDFLLKIFSLAFFYFNWDLIPNFCPQLGYAVNTIISCFFIVGWKTSDILFLRLCFVSFNLNKSENGADILFKAFSAKSCKSLWCILTDPAFSRSRPKRTYKSRLVIPVIIRPSKHDFVWGSKSDQICMTSFLNGPL